jgi:hypothetical protein
MQVGCPSTWLNMGGLTFVSLSFLTSGACSLQEQEHQITYQGCTANVTLTYCKGFCPSLVR